jgi:hypothetical protein
MPVGALLLPAQDDEASRRKFLGLMGASLALAGASEGSCDDGVL